MSIAAKLWIYIKGLFRNDSLTLSFNEVAQASHVFIAAWAVATSQLIWRGNAKYWASLGVLLFAAVKEFWYDHTYETPQTRGSDLEDFLFYALGTGAELLFLIGRR
jgi:hypothetical protein